MIKSSIYLISNKVASNKLSISAKVTENKLGYKVIKE